MNAFRTALLALALAAMAALALLPVDAAAQQTTRTWVVDATEDNRFVSADNGTSEVTVEVGDTVRWEFDQSRTMGHTVTNNSPNWTINQYRDPGGQPVEHTFDSVGEYRYFCSLHSGMTGTVNVVPDAPANRAPTASPVVDPKDGPAPLYVHFEARASDPDGDPLTYRWDFGDNSPVSTADHAHHTYSTPGTYAATLKVSDGKGGEYNQTFPITVSGSNTQAPTVDGSANPTTGAAPLSVAFMASGNDPQGDTLTYSWDFGVPNTDADKATGNRVFYQYKQPGTYTATVTARDPGGNTGTDTVQVVVSRDTTTPPETEITAGPSGVTKYPSASFWFLSSEPGEGGFECSLDEGAFSTCSAPKGHEGLSSGEHTFQVRAFDGDGNRDASPASRTWTVDATKPYVGGLKPRAGSSVRDRTPRIQATVRDSRTDLAKDDVRLYLDGRNVFTFSYDPETDVLGRVPSSPLSHGSHTVKVTGTDEAGNTTAKKWRFNVKRR